MILITLRDMQWRARRVLLGLAATALVLAMTSLLGALHDGFLRETDRTIDFFGADQWLVASQVAGPFTSNTPVRTSLVGESNATPASATSPRSRSSGTWCAGSTTGFTDVNVIGYQPGGVVVPHPVVGPYAAARGRGDGRPAASTYRSARRCAWPVARSRWWARSRG